MKTHTLITMIKWHNYKWNKQDTFKTIKRILKDYRKIIGNLFLYNCIYKKADNF